MYKYSPSAPQVTQFSSPQARAITRHLVSSLPARPISIRHTPMNRQGSLEKLIDYLRAEATRLLIESSAAPANSVPTSSSIPVAVGPPLPENPSSFSVSCPTVVPGLLIPMESGSGSHWQHSSTATVLRRPSAPEAMPFHHHLRRESSSSSCSQTSSTQHESNSMAMLLARAKANVSHELEFQAMMGDRKKAAMLEDLTMAHIQLDVGFRRWTEEVTQRSLNAPCH